MTRTQNFMYNVIASVAMQIIIMFVGFILPKIMLSCYGSEINGIVTSITQFISYFTLLEAGLGSAAVYALYKPLAEKNFNEINGIASATNKFYIKSGFIFFVCLVLLSIMYPLLSETSSMSKSEMLLLIFIIGISGILDFFTLGKYRAILTADLKTYILSLVTIFYYILYCAIIAIFSYFGLSIVMVRGISILAVFLRTICLMIYCKKNYNYLNYKVKPNNKALNKRWDALILQILGTVQRGMPVVLATFFTTFVQVSIYSIYNMVMIGIAGIFDIFTNGLGASFGNIIAKGEKEVLKKVYNDFEFIYYFLITLIYGISIILIIPFIRLYTKGVVDINYCQESLGALFVINGYLYNLKTPQGMLVISAGLYKETKWQTITQVTILIVLGCILTPYYGLQGILISSCISNLYRVVDLIFYIPKRVTHLSPFNTIKRITYSIISSVLMILSIKIILFKFSLSILDSWGKWITSACCVGLYFFILLIFITIIFDKVSLHSSFSRIKGMLLKRA